MSLILDALNRADTERKNQTPVPDLNTRHHPVILESDSAPRSWIWLVAGAVLILLVVFLAWRWFTVNEQPITAPAVPAAEPSHQNVPAVIATQPTAPEATPTTDKRPIPSLASAVAIVPGSKTATNDVSDLYAEEAVPSAVEDDVSQLYAIEESTGSESVVDPFASQVAAPMSLPPAEVVREPARTFDSMTHIQDFNELAWNAKQKMPTISYQRHDYLAGGISSVVINGQTLGVGNIATTGQFVVQDILVDGVVLKHGDKVFKLRALNGWINM